MRVRTFLALLALGSPVGCSPELSPGGTEFRLPLPGQLSAAGTIPVELTLGPDAVPGSLQLFWNGEPVAFAASGGTVRADLPDVAAGWHDLTARLEIRCEARDGRGEPHGCRRSAQTGVRFEVAAFDDTPGCDPLNQGACLLPFPSQHFLEPAATDTGFRVALPAGGMPRELDKRLSPEPYRTLDGFSPAAQVLMHFPSSALDLAASGAAILAPETRTTDDRSLASDSPTVLVDLESGERLLHFVELDATARPFEAERRGLFLRPLANLQPGRRYAVAVRGLRNEDGTAVGAEPAFAALRDGRPTDIAAVAGRRDAIEALLTRLAALGVAREDLILAFEFTVASRANTVDEGVAMRDAALAWLEARRAVGETLFEIDAVEERDCASGGVFARIVDGRFAVPLFLSGDLVADPVSQGQLVIGASGLPEIQGVVDAPLSLSIPCVVAENLPDPPRALIVGHGGFGYARRSVTGMIDDMLDGLRSVGEDHALVPVATDQWGWSRNEFLPDVISGFFTNQWLDKDDWAALPDRSLQGTMNSVLLASLIRNGDLRHPALTLPDGSPLFPGGAPVAYAGVSAGSDIGPMLAALSPDVDAIHLAVGGTNPAIMFPRNSSWFLLDLGLESLQGPDPLDLWVTLGLLNELYARGLAAAYAPYTLSGELADGEPNRVLMSSVLYDANVAEIASTYLARTIGISSLEGTILPARAGIEDTTGSQDSGLIFYDTGLYDPDVEADRAFIPPVTNEWVPGGPCVVHGKLWDIPAASVQARRFLELGTIEPLCDGPCDAGDVFEQVDDANPCDG